MFKQVKFKKKKKYHFSGSRTKSSNSNHIDYFDIEALKKLTIRELRQIAKDNFIKLRGKRNKDDIVQIIHTFFLTKKVSSDMKVISPKFPIVSDSEDRINISLWFRVDGRIRKFNRLERFLRTRDVIRLTKQICKREKLKKQDVICRTGEGVFVVVQLALLAAAYLKAELLYDIYSSSETIKKLQEKLEVSEALLARAERRRVPPQLLRHRFLSYAYECNNYCKFGESYVNRSGQRPKSHRTSVPNLEMGYMIYASRSHVQDLNRAIKKRFGLKAKDPEHAPCKIDELRSFAYNYMEVMKYPHEKESPHTLRLFNIYLK